MLNHPRIFLIIKIQDPFLNEIQAYLLIVHELLQLVGQWDEAEIGHIADAALRIAHMSKDPDQGDNRSDQTEGRGQPHLSHFEVKGPKKIPIENKHEKITCGIMMPSPLNWYLGNRSCTKYAT